MMSYKVKNVRTVQERLLIIQEAEKNPHEKRVDLAKRLNLAPSTLNSILAKKDMVKKQYEKLGNLSTKRKTNKESKYAELENILYDWYQQLQLYNIPVDGSIVREKAKQIASDINITDFKASNGWISRFKNRHGLVFKKLACEKATRETDIAEVSADIIKDYAAKDIYSADETALFYRCFPDETPVVQDRMCRDGKLCCQRITVLLCANSDGSHKLEPLVIGKSSNPKCLKGIQTFPVKYKSNSKALMTVTVFQEFLTTLNTAMKAQGRKILLFVHNCESHSLNGLNLNHIKVVTYPSNDMKTPLSTDILTYFKQNYRKLLVQKAVCYMNVGIYNRENLNINLLEAMHFILAAWQRVTPISIKNSFTKCIYGFKEQAELHRYHPEVLSEASAELDTDFLDWYKFSEQKIDFETYVNCDKNIITCEADMISDLCDETDTVKEEDDDYDDNHEPEP
ncbi:Major centromere autoantigen B, partial [Stegodyphus mimosarum]